MIAGAPLLIRVIRSARFISSPRPLKSRNIHRRKTFPFIFTHVQTRGALPCRFRIEIVLNKRLLHFRLEKNNELYDGDVIILLPV